jgi:DNA-binding transcriptional LysR family regulator
MHIKDLDLNLLRLFDAVYLERNVSRAAERLNLTQPAASQGLMRLRRALGDPLFERAPGGVRPSPRAERLARSVQSALSALGDALNESAEFHPMESSRAFRLHLSDIGEARFLPALMAALRELAPGVRLESQPLPHAEIASALDSGRLDLALGFLPTVSGVSQQKLLDDRYIVLLRARHPFVQALGGQPVALESLRQLEYAAVRSHADTLRILQWLKLDDRLRLTAAHFLALPDIVRETDLGVLMPRNIAQGFASVAPGRPQGDYAVLEPAFPLRDFTVSVHWSRRFEADPALLWLRGLVIRLFGESLQVPQS